MKAFAELYAALDQTTKTNGKIAALTRYLSHAPLEDAAWAVSFLIGRRPKRLLESRKLAEWAIAEAGVPGYEFVVWYGIMVPGATPRAIILKLNAEIARLLNSQATRERYAVAGLEPISNSHDEFAAQLKREIPEWKKIAKDANIRVE